MKHGIFKPAGLLVFLCLASCGQSSTDETLEQATEDPAIQSSIQSSVQSSVQSPNQPVTLDRTASPEGARVFFITPADGATVSNPVRIEFGIEGMAVAKAGDNQPNSGHHHLLVDTGLPQLGAPVPADANHIHFGDGSTSTEITLEPGQHTLCLLLGDYLHIPHDPPLVSKSITITVE